MTSRFLQMFKRGRYVSGRTWSADEAVQGDDSARRKEREERERFSVAAIAFCIEHDASFKRHFLHAVAHLSPEDVTKVTLEPQQYADLVLEGPRHVLVLEFKLGAPLQDHQSPETRTFWETGYGAKIRKRFPSEKKELRYIVIGKDFEPCDVGGLQCTAIPWTKLLMPSDQERESSIERDLYDCLGHLGATVFLNRHMTNYKLATEANGAMTVFSVLYHLLLRNGIPTGKYDGNMNSIGLTFQQGKDGGGALYNKLVETIQPETKDLGWLGYEKGEDEKGCLSVYFHANSKTLPSLLARLQAAEGIDCTTEVEEGSMKIVSYLPCDKSANDLEWFEKILKTAAGV